MVDSSSVATNAKHADTAREVVTLTLVPRPASGGAPYTAPDLAPYFVPRSELVGIKKLLMSRSTATLAPIALFGPPGVGKSTVATALAHDANIIEAYPDGILWMSLGEGIDVQHAQAQWGAIFGLDLSHLPDTTSRAGALRAVLHTRRCLLIIDDVTDVEQVRALNVGGPSCARIIATEGNDVSLAFKARRFEIDRMTEEDSLRLLTEWAGLLPDIYLPTIKEIVKRLTYSPLALALVGGQARQGITWLRLLEVLRDDQGPIATLDIRDPEVRRNALGLVVNLVLSRFGGLQLQRSALLGAFGAGMGAPFAVEAAAVCWDMAMQEAEKTLQHLADAALVHRLPNGYYILHQALRDHLRKAANPAALADATRRLRGHYLNLIEQSGTSPGLIDRELGQIMAAYRQAAETDSTIASLFADALISHFERAGLWGNLVAMAATTVEQAHRDGDVMREHTYLNDLGYALTVLGNHAEARKRFERSLEISQALGDPAGESSSLNNIGAILEREGKYIDAEGFYRRSLSIREGLGMQEDITETLNNIAGVLFWQKRYDEALSTFQRVLDMYGVLNNRRGQAQTLINIGAVYESQGSDFEALQTYQQSLAIYTNLNEEDGQSQALNNIGIIYLHMRDFDKALSSFKRSLALKEKLGDRVGQASTLNNIALLYESTGSYSLALEHYERSYEIYDVLEDPRAEVVEDNIQTVREKIQRSG